MLLNLQMELCEIQSLHPGAGTVVVQRWEGWDLIKIDSEIRASVLHIWIHADSAGT